MMEKLVIIHQVANGVVPLQIMVLPRVIKLRFQGYLLHVIVQVRLLIPRVYLRRGQRKALLWDLQE